MRLACRAATLFLLCVAWLLPPIALAQQAAQSYVLPLGVYDKQDQLIKGVTPERIQVKKVRATVRRLELDTGPRRIILLLDMSGSMGREQTWTHAIKMAKEFVSTLEPKDQMALHVFADKHEVLVPFTQDFQAVASRIDTLTKQAIRGRTVLDAAFASILAEDKTQARFGDAIVLISDAVGKTQKLKELKARLLAGGWRILLLIAARPYQDDDLWPATIGFDMHELAWDSGGGTMSPWVNRGGMFPWLPPENIAKVARAAYGLVRNVYRVELEVSEPIKKLRKLELEVLDERGKKIPYEQVTYPRFLAPPPMKL